MKRTKPKPRTYWAVEFDDSNNERKLISRPNYGSAYRWRQAFLDYKPGVFCRVVKVQVLEPRSRKKRSPK